MKTKLVGILNVTPDSFSDGGHYLDPKAAIAAARKLAQDGADVIDIGAESTRPGAVPVSADEEWSRLQPVLADIMACGVPVSVDTRHAQTASRALKLGAAWINDVSGFADAAMVEAVKRSHCKLVFMHSLSVPANKNMVMPESADVVAELLAFAHTRMGYLEAQGIVRERLIFDPGIGFGKTPAQSRAIIKNIVRFKALGVPILIGHSRKSFLGEGGRDAKTLEMSRFLAEQGMDYLRVHDVKAHKEMLEKNNG